MTNKIAEDLSRVETELALVRETLDRLEAVEAQLLRIRDLLFLQPGEAGPAQQAPATIR